MPYISHKSSPLICLHKFDFVGWFLKMIIALGNKVVRTIIVRSEWLDSNQREGRRSACPPGSGGFSRASGAKRPLVRVIFAKKKPSAFPQTVSGPSDWIRTSGLLNPIQARYQTSPHPDILFAPESLFIIAWSKSFCKHFFRFFYFFRKGPVTWQMARILVYLLQENPILYWGACVQAERESSNSDPGTWFG